MRRSVPGWWRIDTGCSWASPAPVPGHAVPLLWGGGALIQGARGGTGIEVFPGERRGRGLIVIHRVVAHRYRPGGALIHKWWRIDTQMLCSPRRTMAVAILY